MAQWLEQRAGNYIKSWLFEGLIVNVNSDILWISIHLYRTW